MTDGHFSFRVLGLPHTGQLNGKEPSLTLLVTPVFCCENVFSSNNFYSSSGLMYLGLMKGARREASVQLMILASLSEPLYGAAVQVTLDRSLVPSYLHEPL